MKPKKKSKLSESKTLSPRVRAETRAWFAENFTSPNAGAEAVMEAFPDFVRYTLAEIRGVFTKSELLMALDILNGHGTIITSNPQQWGRTAAINCEDAFHLDPGMYEEKWKVDPKKMLPKLKTLSFFQMVALELWAAWCWEGEKNFDAEAQKLSAPDSSGIILSVRKKQQPRF